MNLLLNTSMAGRRPKILDFLLFSIKNKYKYFRFYLEFQWLFYFSAQFKDVFMTLMTIFQFNDILMTSRNLMTGGHPVKKVKLELRKSISSWRGWSTSNCNPIGPLHARIDHSQGLSSKEMKEKKCNYIINRFYNPQS